MINCPLCMKRSKSGVPTARVITSLNDVTGVDVNPKCKRTPLSFKSIGKEVSVCQPCSLDTSKVQVVGNSMVIAGLV